MDIDEIHLVEKISDTLMGEVKFFIFKGIYWVLVYLPSWLGSLDAESPDPQRGRLGRGLSSDWIQKVMMETNGSKRFL